MIDGLKKKYRQAIISLIAASDKVEKALLFGSRATETFTPSSDIDIALFGKDVTLSDQAKIAGAIEAENIPQKVDLLRYHRISNKKLKAHIHQHGVVWYKREGGVGLVRLEYYCNINPESITKDYSQEIIQYIDISSVGTGEFSVPPKIFPLSETPSRAKRIVKKNDIILSTVRPNRRSFKLLDNVQDNDIASSDFSVLRTKRGVDPRFVYYIISDQKFTDYLVSHVTGSAYPAVSPDSIISAPVPLFNSKEQKAIADVLSALDNKIELTRQLSASLEKTASTLFKSWFVDFDPVKAKAVLKQQASLEGEEASQGQGPQASRWGRDWTLERAKRYLSQLDSDIAALFPDGFSSSKMGEIPKGWGVDDVEEVIEINPPMKLSKNTVAPFVGMKALPTTGYSVGKIIKKPYAGGAKFQNDDILLARITPCLENGKTAIVDFLDRDQIGFGSTEFIVLRGKDSIKTPFLACLARSKKFRAHCIQSMVGSSGRQRVQNACFANFCLSLPEHEALLNQFHLLTEGSFLQITKYSEQSRILANLRNTLLPKLISGELRVKDVEGVR